MIKVACISCENPYELDERRLPPSGLKMKCPKCGTSFMVFPDGRTEAAPPPGLPKAPPKPPAPARPAIPKPPAPAPAASLDDDLDLPAPAGKPLPARPAKPAASPFDEDLDLPAAKPAKPAAAIAPPAKPTAPAMPAALDASLDADLPAPRRAIPMGPPPAATPAKAPAPFDDELDLPAARPRAATKLGVAGPPDELDLPAPRAAKPAAAAPAKAPKPLAALDSFSGEMGLPVQRKQPSIKPALADAERTPFDDDFEEPVAAKAPADDFGLDLPAPRGASPKAPADFDLDLPAPRAAAPKAPAEFDLDLPAPRGAGPKAPAFDLDLPAPRAAAPKAPAQAADFDLDLPAPRGKTTAGGFDLDLPAPKAKGGDFDLDLPAPRGKTTAGGFDLDLPAPKAKGGDFDLDLPAPRGRGGEIVDLPQPAGFADLPGLAAELPGLAAELPGVAAQLPGIAAQLPAPAAGLPAPLDLPQARRRADLPALPDSAFDDLDFGPPSGARASGAARARPPTSELELPLGERQHGEVDLGPVGSRDDMEFADIPQESGSRAGAPLPAIADHLPLPEDKPAPTKAAAPVKRSRAIPIALGTALLLGGAGAALSFTPLGPFGYYAIEQFLPGAGDATRVRATLAEADRLFLEDSASSARHALVQLGQLRHDAGLNRELLARSLFFEAFYIVRFHDDFGGAPRAAAIRQRLDERNPEDPMLALALAADQLRVDNATGAASQLQRARSFRADDPFVDLLAGELALRNGDAAAAMAAFDAASGHGGGAASAWGRARALRLQATQAMHPVEGAEPVTAPDEAAVTSAVDATLAANPLHVDARLERARIAWSTGDDDAAMNGLLEVVGARPVGDAQLVATGSSRAAAYVLLGEIHERRGRLSQALEAYAHANEADSNNADGLLGSGRMLLEQRRASEALARFESVLGRQDAAELTTSSGRTATAEASLGAARAMLLTDRAQDARASLEALANATPNDSEVLLWFGRAEEQLENYDAAEFQFRECIRVSPTTFDGYLALARLYGRRDRTSDAQAVLDEARAHVPESGTMRRELGELELQRGVLPAAIQEFRRALELEPGLPPARFGLASALRRSGQLEDAANAFEELAAVDPGYPGLALERGLLFEARGEAGRAVEFYRRALEERPDAPDLLLRLGAAQVAAGDIDDAQHTLEEVQRAVPQSGEAEHFVGRIDFARGNYPEALQHFERAIALDSNHAEFYLYAGWAALETGNLGRALERVGEALERDAALGDGYWIRGTIRLRTGAVRDALDDFHRALELHPGRVEAQAGLGECFDQLRQLSDAVAAYQRAVEAAPTRGEWWYRLGRLQLDSAHTTDAVRALSRATILGEAEPHRPAWLPDAHRVLGDAMHLTGERSGAIEHYRRYLEIASAGAIDRDTVRENLLDLGVAPP